MSEVGKEKVEFVKWLMKKGVPLEEAKLICHRKFYRGIPPGWKKKNEKQSDKKRDTRPHDTPTLQ